MRVIAGSAKRIPLKTIDGLSTRPTTDRIKETLFNMIQDDVFSSDFLDLFAGSGQMGIEALSRGANSATFVENNPRAVSVIKENLQKTRLMDQAKIHSMDVLGAISSMQADSFDVIFMDPPYQMGIEERVLSLIKDYSILRDDGFIIIEASLDRDFSTVSDLGYYIWKEKTYKTNKHVFLSLEGTL